MRLGIRDKILLYSSVILLLAFGSNILILGRVFQKEYIGALESKIRVVANGLKLQLERLLGLGIAPSDIEGFDAQCQEVVRKHQDVSYAMIVDTSGLILFQSDLPESLRLEVLTQNVSWSGMDMAPRWMTHMRNQRYHNTRLKIDSPSSPSDLYVIIGFPESVINNKVAKLLKYGLFVGILCLGGAVLLLLAGISCLVTQPLSRLVHTIDQIHNRSDLSIRVGIRSQDEIGRLSRNFDDMTARLEQKTTSIENLHREIDERQKAEEALAHLNDELQDTVKQLTIANRELSDFAHITAHDLKVPLRGIGTIADWLQEDYADIMDPDARDKIALLSDRSKRMYQLIDDILKYSEIGYRIFEIEEISLEPFVHLIISNLAPPKSIQITVSGTLPILFCERVLLYQIFMNLLKNAFSYVDQSTGKVSIDCAEEEDTWHLRVTDNGPGIQETYHEKIFKIFQTLSDEMKHDSTGIGLAIVRKSVERLNGHVWVESTLGHGATFHFTLPKQHEAGTGSTVS